MDQEESGIQIEGFKGMVTNKDPHALEPNESQSQVNCTSRRFGELVLRMGIRQLTFDS